MQEYERCGMDIFVDLYGFMVFYGFPWSGLERKTPKWLPSFGEQGFNWGTYTLMLSHFVVVWVVHAIL